MTALDGAAVTACDGAVARLLAATAASRVTLRLEDAGGGFPVVAEACAAGVPSLRAETGIDLRAAATFIALERDREILLQEDLEHADPAPPAALIEKYGARAQMLAPVVADGRLLGIVSVHESAGPRPWRPQDIEALISATAAIADAIGADRPAPSMSRSRSGRVGTEHAGRPQLRDAAGVVAADRAQDLVGVLAAQRRAPARQRVAAQAQRRGDLADRAEARVVDLDDVAARLDVRVGERLGDLVDGAVGDAGGGQRPHPLVGRARANRRREDRQQHVAVAVARGEVGEALVGEQVAAVEHLAQRAPRTSASRRRR